MYEPSGAVTALELIERMPDLTDRRKILSTMFIKKRIQPEIPEEHLTDFDEISEDLQGLPSFSVILFLAI